MTPDEVFPEVAGRFLPFPEELTRGLVDAVRISLVQEKAQALTMPATAHKPQLGKVFRPNSSTSEYLHGPVGYVSLTVQVPAGRRLTVIRADEVQARDVAASISLVGCKTSQVERLRGDIVLLDTPLESATNVTGLLLQRWYGFGGMRWDENRPVAERSRDFSCRIDGVDGEVDIDVGRAQIDICRATGRVRVSNRHGTTRALIQAPLDGQRHQLMSVSGAVRVSVNAALLPDIRLACATLCGRILYDAFADAEDKPQANSQHLGVFSTIPAKERGSWQRVADAELMLKTESGEIVVAKAD